MSNTVTRTGLYALCLNLVLAFARAQAADLYVSTQGSDSSPGTAAQPFRTITHAYSRAAAGTVIHVLPGVYTDYRSGWGIHLGKSGTASSPIVLRSTVRGGAIIDGGNAADRNQGLYISGSYNTVEGFEIRNGPHGGIAIYGNNNRIINNEIHHNGNPASSSGNGQDGVYSNEGTSGNFYGANSIHDNGRTGSNLDHGLYLCGRNETVINNLLYRNAATGLQVAGYATVSGMKVYNNVVAWNGTTGIILWLSLNGVDIKNNIIYRNGNYGVGSYDAHGSGVVVDHNLCFNNGGGNYNFTAGGSDYGYTLGASISADPLFVNGTSANFNPRLGSGSPAIGAGVNLSSTFTTDINGAARPGSGAWDLGAYVSTAANTAPSISSMVNRTISAGGSTGPLAFTVGDAQTSAGSLTVSGSSSQTALVPNANIVFGGSGSSRTVTITPASGQTGTATITLRVSDGFLSSTTSFVVTVNPLAAPVVALTSPVNGATYDAPATINLAANVTANGHTITKVQFYEGTTLLTEDTASPYAFSHNIGSARSCALRATAVYGSGSTVSSASVTVTVKNPPIASGLTFDSTSGAITAPFSIVNNTIVQPAYTSLSAGGQAVYAFNVPAAGDYVVSALVNAPSTDYNSLFVNIDAQPTDPQMIWDVPVTSGLVSQTVSWRGNGAVSSTAPSGVAAQEAPKVFRLSAGTHQLVIRGREGNCQVGTITIEPYGQNTPPTISSIANQDLTAGNSSGPLAFTVDDAEVAATSLEVSASSSNPSLVPTANIVLGGSGASRTVTVTPASGQTGTATIALTVSDGSLSSSTGFTLTVVNPPVASGLTFEATSGAISRPFEAVDGAIAQPAYTSLAAGGQAVYTFNVNAAGYYVVSALINAPSTDNNSLFVNIDTQPTDPLMVWDIPVTSGFESQMVSWRGNGTVSSSAPSGLTAQYAPKVFSLTAGTHQLIIRGREGNCQLGTITVAPTTLSAN
ncbi:MAG TPA: right-handed parallel beta-helix repeat-containing protein [Candidatus Paceibacterota bacterium]|nr:right-handed parallel beta-helix repeat-containing protein [Candidatus Paceibacterota bacterium]